jgi:Rps23 Pro-64 3,4-dihydroxylase Tpa1-like proline 4-hydroxylase
MIDFASLNQIKEYDSQDPFPHAVFDNFFSSSELNDCAMAIKNNIDTLPWLQRDYQEFQLYKKWIENVNEMPPQVQKVINKLYQAEFLNFLKDLTGVSGIMADPLNVGGGIHATFNGGKLGVHKDFNYNIETCLRRKINVLVYLNKFWNPEWGGALELWSREKKCKVKEVNPVFNRMVIFNTDSDSLHGFPKPLTCPDNEVRLSLATYYYVYEEKPTDNDFLSRFYDVRKKGELTPYN